jgi:hypothetical protein
MPILTGVDIDLMTLNPQFGDTNITVEILDNNNNNNILATASQIVHVGSTDPGLVHFNFANDVPVTVGSNYTIYVPGSTDTFGLKYSTGDSYPNGFMTYSNGVNSYSYAGWDLFFQTWGRP